ncbi:benzoate membrane transport protein [Alteribacillus persepolensis]|uniref:Benzoate membrane transport protein n=1 Tax=Alteribacillus persepolensis TaxID=568899 RepID=A0A1G8EDA4_9BACI|nr:benzoate/H(+) symporter BenE family transporter [Alteribacillus persepolensis]SDH67925.1 benzoate membrane transport protein [Alteribacillus persepolensis]
MTENKVGFQNGVSDFISDINPRNTGTGMAAGIFGLSAGVVMISAGQAAGLNPNFIIAWVTGQFLLCGLFGIFIPTYYRQPIPMATSIPGALLFTAVIPSVGLGPALGATLIAGVLSFIIGKSGLMGKLIHYIPSPIIMGMVGGVLLSFGLGMITPLENAFIPAILMISAFFIVTKYLPKFPAVLGALMIGLLYIFISDISFTGVEFVVNYPSFVLPEFTLSAFLAYGLPLTIILIGMETPAGVGLLKSVGFKQVPTNGITSANGIGTIVGSFFNLHSLCIAAPMTGICSSPESGKLEARWVSAVIVGIIFFVAAPFYGILVSLLEITPGFIPAIIAGLALMSVLITTIGGSLGASNYKMGALIAFLTAASDITLLGIGSSFWALVFGVVVSLFIETADFKQQKFERYDKNGEESVQMAK